MCITFEGGSVPEYSMVCVLQNVAGVPQTELQSFVLYTVAIVLSFTFIILLYTVFLLIARIIGGK